MNKCVKPTENFEDVLRSRGFELYGLDGGNANWIAKIENGYLTMTCDGFDTCMKWTPNESLIKEIDNSCDATILQMKNLYQHWLERMRMITQNCLTCSILLRSIRLKSSSTA